MKKTQKKWLVEDYGVFEIEVKKTTQQRPNGLPPVTVFRDDFGVTYPKRRVKNWNELTAEQKASVYIDISQRNVDWLKKKLRGSDKGRAEYLLNEIKKEKARLYDMLSAIRQGEKVKEPTDDDIVDSDDEKCLRYTCDCFVPIKVDVIKGEQMWNKIVELCPIDLPKWKYIQWCNAEIDTPIGALIPSQKYIVYMLLQYVPNKEG